MIYIGIDPAFRKGGIGFCRIENKKVSFSKYSFIELMIFIQSDRCINYLFCVENSNLQNTSFDLSGNKSVVARKSRNVGSNQALSQIICDQITFYDYKLIEVSPKQKGRKLDNNTTQKLISSNGFVCNKKTTNQDERDAFKLALIGYNRDKI